MSDHLPSPAPSLGSLIQSIIQGSTAVPKSIAKLIDTVGEQIGLFMEPIHTVRRGQADATVQVATAKAKADIAVTKLHNKFVLQDIEGRAAERVHQQEMRRQRNIESIAGKAAVELPENVAEQPVEPDWVAQFFSQCQDVSDEQMQVIWARLLASEIATPGTFSLRTLVLVRNLSKPDANLFTRFCSLVWEIANDLYPITPKHLPEPRDFFGFTFADFVHLDALGLIRFEPLAGVKLISKSKQHAASAAYRLCYFSQPHMFSHQASKSQENALPLHTGCALLTDIGKELAPIAGAAPNEEYRAYIIRTYREQGWDVAELPVTPGV